VSEAQTLLQRLGFNPGGVDGNSGPMTRGAVMHYQEAHGFDQTGKVDQTLLDKLHQDVTPPAEYTGPSADNTPSLQHYVPTGDPNLQRQSYSPSDQDPQPLSPI
jgi:peptidoglycan hydrolase-like protein with peptidoglycan-binding domain